MQESQPRIDLLIRRRTGISQGLERGHGLAGCLEGRFLAAHVAGQPGELELGIGHASGGLQTGRR